MGLTLGQGAQLLANESFLSRVRGAMVRAALAVANEEQGGQSVDNWGKRRNLATRVLNSPDSHLGSFAAAVAADAGNALSFWQPQPVFASTADNPAAIGTAAAHGLSTGDVVEVAGHAGNTVVNGTWVVTVTGDWSFTVPVPGTVVGGATGTLQKHISDADLSFTISAVFGPIAGVNPEE